MNLTLLFGIAFAILGLIFILSSIFIKPDPCGDLKNTWYAKQYFVVCGLVFVVVGIIISVVGIICWWIGL